MRRMKLAMTVVAMLLGVSPAMAADTIDAGLADQIRKALPMMDIGEIRATPMTGIYELAVGHKVLYTDATGRYVMVGRLFDVQQDYKDLTEERIAELQHVEWSSLPLEQAIESGDLKSKLKLAVFSDPDCPYCRQLEHNLKSLKGVHVYTFLFPLAMHRDAFAKSESIWCSKDRHAAMLKVMLEKGTLEKADCKTPVASNQALGASLGIHGTPTLIAGDGRMISGALSAEQITAWLEDGQ